MGEQGTEDRCGGAGGRSAAGTVEPLITHTPSVDRRMYGLRGAMACGKVLKIDTIKSPNYAAIY